MRVAQREVCSPGVLRCVDLRSGKASHQNSCRAGELWGAVEQRGEVEPRGSMGCDVQEVRG